MKWIVSILVRTPPLMFPARILAICAIFGVDLDGALPWTIGGKTWRIGSMLDLATLVGAMWELARAVRIDSEALNAAIMGMILARVFIGIIMYFVPALWPDLNVINLLVAIIVAPALAMAVRVCVARRDVSFAR